MLVLQFVPDAKKALSEMQRVVRPGGIVAATVWDALGGMPALRLFWDATATLGLADDKAMRYLSLNALFSFPRWILMKVRMPRYELAPLTIAKMENSKTCGS